MATRGVTVTVTVEVMRPYLERLERQRRTGVAAIGVAQEFQRVFTGTTHHAYEGGGDIPRFSYAKADRRITAYYFYLVDEAFGPVFIKSVRISRPRSRSGLMGTNTPSVGLRQRGSRSPSWTKDSPPLTIRLGCRISATR